MATLTQWEIVTGGREWVGPIEVTVNSTPVTTFEVAVCEGVTRPTTWGDPDDDPDGGGDLGVIVGADSDWELTLNKVYTIFGRYTDNPEEPWFRIGKIKAT